jgi:hypothetical protein
MIMPESSRSNEVEHLMRNAQLRDALEPLVDESISRVNAEIMTTCNENEFLESMLEWERAPMLPIREWFDPHLEIPSPEDLDDNELSALLHDTVEQLYAQHVVLDFTDHLTDRQLYCLIYRDILSSHEKRIRRKNNYLHWDCANANGDPETWLRYYASQEEREIWASETGQTLPEAEPLPSIRKLPKAPM